MTQIARNRDFLRVENLHKHFKTRASAWRSETLRAVNGVSLLHCARGDARIGRRIRLRQVDARSHHSRPLPADARFRSARWTPSGRA